MSFVKGERVKFKSAKVFISSIYDVTLLFFLLLQLT